jgi:hypothetical protein
LAIYACIIGFGGGGSPTLFWLMMIAVVRNNNNNVRLGFGLHGGLRNSLFNYKWLSGKV